MTDLARGDSTHKSDAVRLVGSTAKSGFALFVFAIPN